MKKHCTSFSRRPNKDANCPVRSRCRTHSKFFRHQQLFELFPSSSTLTLTDFRTLTPAQSHVLSRATSICRAGSQRRGVQLTEGLPADPLYKPTFLMMGYRDLYRQVILGHPSRPCSWPMISTDSPDITTSTPCLPPQPPTIHPRNGVPLPQIPLAILQRPVIRSAKSPGDSLGPFAAFNRLKLVESSPLALAPSLRCTPRCRWDLSWKLSTTPPSLKILPISVATMDTRLTTRMRLEKRMDAARM